MTEVTISPLRGGALAEVSTEELRVELARALEMTAENLLWLAKLWRELERRGEDLSELRSGIRVFLPMIADGRLDAGAAVQFAGNLTMLRALAAMPIAEQRRIAAGERIAVVIEKSGVWTETTMRADDMTASVIRQVFAAGRRRTPEEQRALLPPTPATPKKPRSRLVRLRLTDEEHEALYRAAEAARLTLPEYILSRVREP